MDGEQPPTPQLRVTGFEVNRPFEAKKNMNRITLLSSYSSLSSLLSKPLAAVCAVILN